MQLTMISGASSGIGAALADRALAADHKVATISRRPGPGDHLAADLSDPASWPIVSDWIDGLVSAEAWDRVVFVHNAGVIDPVGFAGHVDPAAYTTNVLLNSASAQVLGERFLGTVSNLDCPAQLMIISSGAGKRPILGWSSYCAGKAAADMWVRTVGAEQAALESKVTVLSVAPGVVDTAMQASIRDSAETEFPLIDQFKELHASGSLLAPGDVAEALFVLAQANAGDMHQDTHIENGAVLDIRDFIDS
ncbi:MAG: SDR family NAD(P)-dependent oxidoreductase [Acidimicrobiales bacterium]|nr:SDR family NAD(P)-dependent oxidoreductase [Acidimicrobiales bacterium]RZV45897.1 MAG: SDR family NAD(P)-dependent oxidoreductase [Acidimicrobiales bacterium]